MEGPRLPAGTADRIRPVTWALALYFAAMALDCVQLGSWGSGLKLLAALPAALALLDVRRLRLRGSPLLLAVGAFFLAAYCSVFYSISAERSLEAVGSLGLNLLLLTVTGGLEPYSRREAEFLTRALVLGSWLTAILLLLTSGTGRMTLNLGGSSADENGVNGYLLFAFAFHMTGFFRQRGWWNLLPAGALLLLGLGTGSRGGLLAFAGVMLLAAAMPRDRPLGAAGWLGRLLLLAAMGAVLGWAARRLLPEPVLVRFTPGYFARHGTTGRLRIWKALWARFLESGLGRQLLGHGYGVTRYLLREGVVAHNLYLDNLMSIGVFGLLAQLALQGTCMVTLARRRQWTLLCAYGGMLILCLSLSLVSYKPLWNVVLMGLIWEGQSDAPQAAGPS